MTGNLPPLLATQPASARPTFQYCLALLWVEAGQMEIVEIKANRTGQLCTFYTATGDLFTLLKPR